jgi:Ca2+-transporting ATPase
MPNWHSMEIDQVIRELDTNPYQGLSDEEVRNRVEKYGYNELKREERQQASFWNLSNILIIILLLAAVFSVLVPIIFRVWIRASEIFKHQEIAFNI